MKAFGRLFIDDALVFLAWLMLLTNTILWQVGRVALYQNIAVSTGKLNPPPNFETETKRYLRNTVVIIIFFYSSLWAIKLSFLIFFKRLGQKVSRQRVLWWIVAVIVAASWFAVLGTIEYKCLLGSFTFLEIGFLFCKHLFLLIVIKHTVSAMVQYDFKGLLYVTI